MLNEDFVCTIFECLSELRSNADMDDDEYDKFLFHGLYSAFINAAYQASQVENKQQLRLELDERLQMSNANFSSNEPVRSYVVIDMNPEDDEEIDTDLN